MRRTVSAVTQQIGPGLGRFPVPVGQRDELFPAVGPDADHDQQAELVLLQADVDVVGVGPGRGAGVSTCPFLRACSVPRLFRGRVTWRSVSSGDSSVLVDHAAEDSVPADRSVERDNGWMVVVGWAVPAALVRSVVVEVPGVLVEDFRGVAFVVDQDPVGALGPEGTGRAGVGTRPRSCLAANRCMVTRPGRLLEPHRHMGPRPSARGHVERGRLRRAAGRTVRLDQPSAARQRAQRLRPRTRSPDAGFPGPGHIAVKDRVNAIALAPAEDFRRDSDIFGDGVRDPEAQRRIRAAIKRGFQTRDAEMVLARMLGDLTDD